MPAVEKIRRYLNALSVFRDGTFQIANSDVATGVVKDLIRRLLWHSSSSSSSVQRIFDYEDDDENEDDLIAALLLDVNWSAFAELKTGCLLAVAQPFVENNALLVIAKPFFKRCLFLASTTIRGRLLLFQNSNKSVST